jgi:hypothetical protein
MKSGMQAYFFLASYNFRSKVFVFVIVKKIRDPDPGGKKHRTSDLGYGSGLDPQNIFRIWLLIRTIRLVF